MNRKYEVLIYQKIAAISNIFRIEIKKCERSKLIQLITEDLLTYNIKDPSYGGNGLLILETSLSFEAVFYYRIAHHIYTSGLKTLGRKISEVSKMMTSIEIHPAAVIGKCFVLDHGIGTVIGETTIIGNDCYILQGVIIGADSISGNEPGKRHPTIGNNVEIGGFSKILGPITIGDNVKIAPHSVIKKNIETNSKIIITSNYQIEKSEKAAKFFYTGYQCGKDSLYLHFVGLIKEFFEDIICLTPEGTIIESTFENNLITLFKIKNTNLNKIDLHLITKQKDVVHLCIDVLVVKDVL